MAESVRKILVNVSEDLDVRIGALAEQTGQSRSLIVSNALDAYVSGQLRWLSEMDAAVAQSSQAASFDGDDVLNWLETWGTDQELARPAATKPRP